MPTTGLGGRDGGVLELLEPPRMPKRVSRPLSGQGSFSRILRTFRRAGVSNSPGSLMPSGLPRKETLGSSVNNARGRSYGRGVAPHDPGAIGPGLCGFPGIILLGSSVNRARRRDGASRPGPDWSSADLRRRASVRPAVGCGGLSVPVWGQEVPQRGQELVGCLLGEPVPGAGNDDALHVVRELLLNRIGLLA